MFNAVIDAIVKLLDKWRKKVDTDNNSIIDSSESLIDTSNNKQLMASDIISYGIPIIDNLQTNENISKGDLLYYDSTVGYLKKYPSNGLKTFTRFYISLESKDGTITPVTIKCIPDGGNIAPSNIIFNSSDKGKRLYVSNINDGKYTITKEGDFTFEIGQVINSDNIYFNVDYNKIKYFGDMGLFIMGWNLSLYILSIEYININNNSNALMFNDNNQEKRLHNSMSNGVNNKTIVSGGLNSSGAYLSTIEYLQMNVISSPLNLFGNLSEAKLHIFSSSNNTNNKGVIGNGKNINYRLSTIEYINFNNSGNSQIFGNSTLAREDRDSSSNGTNGLCAMFAGYTGSIEVNNIDYININVNANALDFGDCSISKTNSASCSNYNYNRAVSCCGWDYPTYYNVMEYINISNPGNALDFGDLSQSLIVLSATSNGLKNRGVTGGGRISSGAINNIYFFNISILSNSYDFGFLIENRCDLSANSNS